MNKLYVSALLLLAFSATAQIINIPDANFKARLLAADVTNNTARDINNNNMKIDANGNGEIEQNEALLVYRLFYTPSPPPRMMHQDNSGPLSPNVLEIADLTGISYFKKIRKLDVSDNLLVSLDISGLYYIDYLNCANNNLTNLNLNGSGSLFTLNCRNNNLATLDLNGLDALNYLYCDNNQLDFLSVYDLSNLRKLYCDNNQLIGIQFGNNTTLEQVFCAFNQLTQIDISNTSAYLLYCNDNPNLSDINIKNGVNSTLTFTVDPLPVPVDSFNFSNLPAFHSLCCDAGEQSVMEQATASIPAVTIATDCIPAIIYIADLTFKNALLNSLCVDTNNDNLPDADADTNNDGEIQVTEALAIKALYLDNRGLTTIEGINQFLNLEELYVSSNQLSGVDVSGMFYLNILKCNHNMLADLQVSDHLISLECDYNNLVFLDLTNAETLYSLHCSHNMLTGLLLPDADLGDLFCSYNQLTELDLSNYSQLAFLNVAYNQLLDLDISASNGQLLYLDISGNLYTDVGPVEMMGFYSSDILCNDTHLTTLDLSQSQYVIHLELRNNPDLKTLNLHNQDIDAPCLETPQEPCRIQNIFENNPSLATVCVDNFELESFQLFFSNPAITLTTDCSSLLTTSHFDNSNEIVMFPNPAHHVLQIDSKYGNGISADIYNITGQLLMHRDYANTIDVSALAGGTYFISITTGIEKKVLQFVKL